MEARRTQTSTQYYSTCSTIFTQSDRSSCTCSLRAKFSAQRSKQPQKRLSTCTARRGDA